MKRKLNAVIHRAVKVLTDEIRRTENDNSLVPIVLNVGIDPETGTFLEEMESNSEIQLYLNFDGRDEELVPDLIIFSGDKIGMDTGIEFLNDTTTVIVEENDGGALRRRNTSAIHGNAAIFSDFVYLDESSPTVIIYSNYTSVIQEVGKPFVDHVNKSSDEWDDLSNTDALSLKGDIPDFSTIEPSGNRSDWFNVEEDDGLDLYTQEEEQGDV